MGESENITLNMIYHKLVVIEQDVKEINDDLHNVRPQFAQRLKEAEQEKTRRFTSLEEMEKEMDKK